MKRSIQLMILLLMVTVSSLSQTATNIKHLNIDSDKLALEGYDPVAYFTEQKALKGKSSIMVEHDGVKYRFFSAANKMLFTKSPATYVPQYGGWCAYAMGAKAEKVEVDPETFKLIDGKLYLFYNRFFNNTLDTWNKNEKSLKANADKNWNKLVTQ